MGLMTALTTPTYSSGLGLQEGWGGAHQNTQSTVNSKRRIRSGLWSSNLTINSSQSHHAAQAHCLRVKPQIGLSFGPTLHTD